MPNIQTILHVVREIAASSNEQLNGANQINSAITQINQVTQENAAAAEELAANSEMFAQQSESLQKIISFFSVSERVEARLKDEISKKIKEMSDYLQSFSAEMQQSGAVGKTVSNKSAMTGINIQMDQNSSDHDDKFEQF